MDMNSKSVGQDAKPVGSGKVLEGRFSKPENLCDKAVANTRKTESTMTKAMA